DRTDMRRDHPERAAVEHAADMLGPDRRHPHERRDADRQRRDADLAGGLQREAGVLDIYIECVEAGRFGDAGDLHVAHQPYRHRGHHLATRELVADPVAQDVADLFGHARPPCYRGPHALAPSFLNLRPSRTAEQSSASTKTASIATPTSN